LQKGGYWDKIYIINLELRELKIELCEREIELRELKIEFRLYILYEISGNLSQKMLISNSVDSVLLATLCGAIVSNDNHASMTFT